MIHTQLALFWLKNYIIFRMSHVPYGTSRAVRHVRAFACLPPHY
jgi:hypothetical protein